LSAVGKGCPDLLAGKQGITYLFEIKRDNKAKFTPQQIEWQNDWKGGIFVRIESIDDVLAL
jgi:Holliday junction resolvase